MELNRKVTRSCMGGCMSKGLSYHSSVDLSRCHVKRLLTETFKGTLYSEQIHSGTSHYFR